MYSRVVPMPHDKSDEDEKPLFDESLDACKTKEEMEEIKEVYDEKSRFLEACLDYNRDLRVLKENETALENIERENQ